eukprot:TRINITY_DN16549_c0_g1_i3.p2 TRINITY_DN16549_c0_g1~~TRINITY_DN16549_c0_g1_i3.p2  ORF type:complete len:102 (+),score=2.69 TRINITY_DN16549_c0_g1_i3:956-1261(+)
MFSPDSSPPTARQLGFPPAGMPDSAAAPHCDTKRKKGAEPSSASPKLKRYRKVEEVRLAPPIFDSSQQDSATSGSQAAPGRIVSPRPATMHRPRNPHLYHH